MTTTSTETCPATSSSSTGPGTTVGHTRDAGWEMGVRRTVPIPRDDAWDRLHEAWLPEWIGADAVPMLVGAPVRRGAESIGRVAGCHVGRRVRLRWSPEERGRETVLQVTLLDAAGGTTVAVHQELLAGPSERSASLERWTEALESLRSGIQRELEASRTAEPALG